MRHCTKYTNFVGGGINICTFDVKIYVFLIYIAKFVAKFWLTLSWKLSVYALIYLTFCAIICMRIIVLIWTLVAGCKNVELVNGGFALQNSANIRRSDAKTLHFGTANRRETQWIETKTAAIM